jgi:SAM-dependent methyltransferase
MAATLRLDLGCGAKARPGFLGLDRFLLPGVSVAADLDAASLPFRDSRFDLIVAFHSLEHVANLMATMRESWRIGKPGAQVVIAAPYQASLLNLANPYHLQAFTEHTPRFWTGAPDTAIDPAEWQEPPLGRHWGLAHSDHSDPGFDLRCVRMEFFYFAEYWGLDPAWQRRARKRFLNACEQILYHLIVFKPPLEESDLEAVASELYLPPELDERRNAARRRRRRRAWLQR